MLLDEDEVILDEVYLNFPELCTMTHFFGISLLHCLFFGVILIHYCLPCIILLSFYPI